MVATHDTFERSYGNRFFLASAGNEECYTNFKCLPGFVCGVVALAAVLTVCCPFLFYRTFYGVFFVLRGGVAFFKPPAF